MSRLGHGTQLERELKILIVVRMTKDMCTHSENKDGGREERRRYRLAINDNDDGNKRGDQR
jgi:hypothetical protein